MSESLEPFTTDRERAIYQSGWKHAGEFQWTQKSAQDKFFERLNNGEVLLISEPNEMACESQFRVVISPKGGEGK